MISVAAGWCRAAAAAAVAVVLGLAAAPLCAQDLGTLGGDTVEIDARDGVSLFDPGKPVPDVRAAYVADGQSPAEAAAASVAADAKGLIRLPFRATGGTVLVWAPGRAPVGIRVNAAVPFQVPMTPALTAEIRVTSPTGEPVVDAEVTAEAALPLLYASADHPPVHLMRFAARTGPGGVVRFEGLSDVPLSVTASSEGTIPATAFPVDPKRGATLLLGRGAKVSGTLRLLPGPVPVEGVTARLGAQRTAVAKDGAFLFDTVPAGTWELSFEGAAIAPPAARTLVLEDGEERAALEIAAFRTSEFRAKLVLPEGAVPPPLKIRFVYPPQTASWSRETFVMPDADGSVIVRDLPPGEGVAAIVASPDFVTMRREGISLPAGEASRQIEIPLVRGGSLTGRILDLDGRPVAGATLVAAPRPGRAPPPTAARTQTEADGRFTLTGMPAGETWLLLPGRPVGGEASLGPILLAAEERKDAGDLKVFAGWRLEGRVPGAPDGASVVLEEAGADLAKAAVEGESFAFDGLAAGEVSLRVEKDGLVAGRGTASLPSAYPVTLPFAPPRLLRGRILDPQGRTVSAARLRAEQVDGTGRSDLAVRDPAGRFEMRLAYGRWRLEATADATSESGVLEVTIPHDAEGEAEIVLDVGALLRGEIAAAEDGHRLEGSVVRALAVGDERSAATARADASGRFELRGVPAGIVRLRIETLDRGVFETEPRGVREAADVDFGIIQVPRGVSARIEVFGAGGTPVAGADVSFECDGGTVRNARTDAYGRALAAALPPGGAVLRVRDESGAVLRAQRVEVPHLWQDWTLRIDVAAGTRVWGQVTAAGRGEPFARVVLRVFAPVSFEVAGVADAQGRYSLPPAPRGEGELEVTAAGDGAPVYEPFEILGGSDQQRDVELPDSGVSGRAEDLGGGTPVADAWLFLRAAGDTYPLAETLSGSDGTFRFARVAPGTYDLLATREGLGVAWVRSLLVRRGVDTTDVLVSLPPEARIVLRLVDLRGRPLSTAWAQARRGSAPDTGANRTGPEVTASAAPDGRVVLRGLAPGRWRLAAGAPGAARNELGIVTIGEGDRDLGDVALRPGGALRIVAIEAGTAALRVPSLDIEVRDVYDLDPRRERRRADVLRRGDTLWTTGADGAVEVPGLAAGEYRVRPVGIDDAEIRVRVREGEVTVAWLPVPLGPPGE